MNGTATVNGTMGVFGENPRQRGRQRGPRSAGQYSLGKRMTLLAKYKVISSSGKSVYSIFLVNTILSLPVDSRRARRPCDRRIVLRLCDARRPDLIENWYLVMAVRSCVLRCRLQSLTWQELTAALPKSLRKFLAAKYDIAS
jgi:hypothetical protein